jgi:hypothetical protein
MYRFRAMCIIDSIKLDSDTIIAHSLRYRHNSRSQRVFPGANEWELYDWSITMDKSPMLVEHTLQHHLRNAHEVLVQLSSVVPGEPPFRYVMLDLILQLAQDLAAGGISLSLVEILDDMLHVLLEDLDEYRTDSSDEPQWVDAA